MGSRGRASSASISVIGPGGVSATRRPDAPIELTDEQAEEWRAVVTRLPADWFGRETHALLVQYCRHAVTARRIAQLIALAEAPPDSGDGAPPAFDLAGYDRLLKCQQRESLCMAALAGKMRISQSATYDKSKKKPVQAKAPWQASQA